VIEYHHTKGVRQHIVVDDEGMATLKQAFPAAEPKGYRPHPDLVQAYQQYCGLAVYLDGKCPCHAASLHNHEGQVPGDV
jgi:hypothetical protein